MFAHRQRQTAAVHPFQVLDSLLQSCNPWCMRWRRFDLWITSPRPRLSGPNPKCAFDDVGPSTATIFTKLTARGRKPVPGGVMYVTLGLDKITSPFLSNATQAYFKGLSVTIPTPN